MEGLWCCGGGGSALLITFALFFEPVIHAQSGPPPPLNGVLFFCYSEVSLWSTTFSFVSVGIIDESGEARVNEVRGVD